MTPCHCCARAYERDGARLHGALTADAASSALSRHVVVMLHVALALVARHRGYCPLPVQ